MYLFNFVLSHSFSLIRSFVRNAMRGTPDVVQSMLNADCNTYYACIFTGMPKRTRKVAVMALTILIILRVFPCNIEFVLLFKYNTSFQFIQKLVKKM